MKKIKNLSLLLVIVLGLTSCNYVLNPFISNLHPPNWIQGTYYCGENKSYEFTFDSVIRTYDGEITKFKPNITNYLEIYGKVKTIDGKKAFVLTKSDKDLPTHDYEFIDEGDDKLKVIEIIHGEERNSTQDIFIKKND